MKKINKKDLSLKKETISYLSENPQNSTEGDTLGINALGGATFASNCLCITENHGNCPSKFGCNTASLGPICCGPAASEECPKYTEVEECRLTHTCPTIHPCLASADNACQSEICAVSAECISVGEECVISEDICIKPTVVDCGDATHVDCIITH